MKKIFITIVSFSVLGLFQVACENATSPENKTGLNNTTLNKKDVKEVYHYKLESCYPKLPDAFGLIKIQMVDEGGFSFDLNAFKLEPGIKYALKAREAVPVEIVCPYTLTDEYIAVADKNGNLKMSGVINLKAGYTIYLFTINNSEEICFHKILEIEKVLF